MPHPVARLCFCLLSATLGGCAVQGPGGQAGPPSSRALHAGQSFVSSYSHATTYGEPWQAVGAPALRGRACLRAEALGGGRYRVELYRAEATSHICNLVAPARLVDDRLVVWPTASPGASLSIRRTGDDLVITDRNPDPRWCGAHASLDGLRFRIALRGPVGARGSCARE